jgi:hypothetical protein
MLAMGCRGARSHRRLGEGGPDDQLNRAVQPHRHVVGQEPVGRQKVGCEEAREAAVCRAGSRPEHVACSGRPMQPGSACSPEPPGSHRGGGAAVQSLADHGLFTRSAARSSVDHPPPDATAPPGDVRRIPSGDTAAWRAAAPITSSEGSRVCHVDARPRSTASRTCEPARHAQCETGRSTAAARRSSSSQAVGPAGQGRSPSRASSPTSHLRPT